MIYNAWKHGDFGNAFPNGECAHDVIKRGMESLRAAAELGDCVVVVGHGAVSKWLAVQIELREDAVPNDLMALPLVAKVLRNPVKNCCCSTLVYDHQTQRFSSERWFETLDGDESAKEDSG